ncbi:MAG: hypothetical protein WA261_08535, partial [Candidatus Sulfotelmatobacter sp.]
MRSAAGLHGCHLPWIFDVGNVEDSYAAEAVFLRYWYVVFFFFVFIVFILVVCIFIFFFITGVILVLVLVRGPGFRWK